MSAFYKHIALLNGAPVQALEPLLMDGLRLEVYSHDHVAVYDPNGLLLAVFDGTLDLGAPVGPSELSGEPGYRFRSDGLDAVLSRDELVRLARRALTPSEYRQLVARFGLIYELHEDFYNPQTGAAEQPC